MSWFTKGGLSNIFSDNAKCCNFGHFSSFLSGLLGVHAPVICRLLHQYLIEFEDYFCLFHYEVIRCASWCNLLCVEKQLINKILAEHCPAQRIESCQTDSTRLLLRRGWKQSTDSSLGFLVQLSLRVSEGFCAPAMSLLKISQVHLPKSYVRFVIVVLTRVALSVLQSFAMGLQHVLNGHYRQDILHVGKSQFLSSFSKDDVKRLISLTICEGKRVRADQCWVIEKQHTSLLGHTLSVRGVVKGTTLKRSHTSFSMIP